MISALTGKLPISDIRAVQECTKLRFKNLSAFVCPEALILYEQALLPEETIHELCEKEYNQVLETPKVMAVPEDVLDAFKDEDAFVVKYSVQDEEVTIGTIPEFLGNIGSVKYNYKVVLVPIYYYVEQITKQKGIPEFLADIPPLDLWNILVHEAIDLGASDITLASTATGAQAYYNVRKKKVRSRRKIPGYAVEAIIQNLATSANATIGDDSVIPRSFSVTLTPEYRGRVEVNKNYYGRLMTVRVLSNAFTKKTLEDLHLDARTIYFIRNVFLSKEKGLRLVIGETSAGKNTTLITAIKELADTDKYKIVSVEQPVEILLEGIEQIPTETDEEFELNAASLLRQNPDYVYFTEISHRTAEPIMQQANTSKAVFSSIHANSISDVLFRLQDITGMPVDRLLLTLQSCIYQELVRDEQNDTVYPVTRCLHFNDALKVRLYGKTLGEVKTILQEIENTWI